VSGALPLARDRETIRIYGLPPPRAASGVKAYRAVDGAVEVEVVADWKRIELRAS
jgi:alpha-glucosidase